MYNFINQLFRYLQYDNKKMNNVNIAYNNNNNNNFSSKYLNKNIYNYLKNSKNQGLEYLLLKDKIKTINSKNLDLIENFTSNISSSNDITELENALNQPNQFLQSEMNELKDLEQQFMKVLSSYSQEYKSYMENIQQFLNNETSQYIGKNVRDTNGAIYYINNFGIARHYSRDAWFKNAHPTCKKNDTDYIQLNYALNSQNSKFTIGEPMKSNQPCGFEGKNVSYQDNQYETYNWSDEDKQYFKENGSGVQQQLTRCEANGNGYVFTKGENNNYPGCGTGYCCKKIDNTEQNLAYIDENSNMRKFNSLSINDVNESCPKGIETITQEIFNSFPLGDNMSIDTLCALGNVDNEQKQKLIQLNQQLLTLSEQIYDKILEAQNKVSNNNQLTNTMNTQLNQQLNSFKINFEELQNVQNKIHPSSNTLNAMFQDNSLLYNSNTLRYMMWSLITLILMFSIFRYLKK